MLAGSGADEAGRRARIEVAEGPGEEVIVTVCLEFESEMMLNKGESAGDESWCTTCLPTSPTPISATWQTIYQSKPSHCQPNSTATNDTRAVDCYVARPGLFEIHVARVKPLRRALAVHGRPAQAQTRLD